MTPRNSASSTKSGATAASSGGSSKAPIILMHESMANNPLQTERDLIRKQEYVMKQQDLALADIEIGVGRLKNKVRTDFSLFIPRFHVWLLVRSVSSS